jgi:general nucleoside transport system permease protein
MSATNSPTPDSSSESSIARELQWLALVLLGTLVLLAVAIRLCGQDPLAAFGALWRGAFGSIAALSATASRAAILVFYAMGVLLSFRAGVLNIGAEGQSRVGAALACALAISALGPTLASVPWIGIPVLLAAGALAGAVWSLIAGFLRWWRGVPEVIATLMLNLAGLLLVKYLVSTHGLLREASSYPRSAPLADALQLGGWAQTEFHAGVFFALPLAFVAHLWLFKTPSGIRLRATGLNPTTSRACGIAVYRVQLWTFAASGALAGFAGALALLARGRLDQEAAFPDFGYMAIAVALIARLRPLNVLPAAILFAGLDVGAKAMQATAGISYWVVYLVEGAIILAVLMRDSSLFSAKDAGPKSAAEAAA